jgi:dihydrofolate reductase
VPPADRRPGGGLTVDAPAPRINLIVAWAQQRVIGRAGTLPWHLPEDLRHFKAITMGHPIIMGRKTWDSIGRPLPGRRSIVVTRQPGWTAPGCETAASLEQALAKCAGVSEVFVIGGAQLFEQALPLAQRLFITQIDARFEGDTVCPPIDLARWQRTAHEHREPDATRPFALDFMTYELRQLEG